MSVPGWLVPALGVWLVGVVFVCALLAAAKRGDAAAGLELPPATLPLATLDRLAAELRAELGVDQVLIVVRDERVPGRAVAVAGSGVSPTVLGASMAPPDSVAAAVAESGRDAIVAAHGPLDRAFAGDAHGDAAAVALAVPAGAVAVARLDAARPLTPADLRRLRALLRGRGSRFRRTTDPQRAAHWRSYRANHHAVRSRP